MDEFISTFHIDWKLMLAQVVNFGLVILALYFLAAKPLRKLIDDRTKEITDGLENAKSNAEILKNTKKEYEEIISKARGEANSIFEAGKKEAEEKKTTMLEKAKAEVDAMIETGKKSLLSEKAKMVDDAKKEIVALVISATEKVAGGKADAHQEERIRKELSSL